MAVNIGCDLMGAMPEARQMDEFWNRKAYPVYYTALIPIEIPSLTKFSNVVKSVKFNAWLADINKILRTWGDVLLKKVARPDEYKRAMNDYANAYQEFEKTFYQSNLTSHYEYDRLVSLFDEQVANVFRLYLGKLNNRYYELIQYYRDLDAQQALFLDAKSYYTGMLQNISDITRMTNVENVEQVWDALLKSKAKEELNWDQWKNQLNPESKEFGIVAALRKQFYAQFPRAQAEAEKKTRAKAKEDEVPYSFYAISTVETTGLRNIARSAVDSFLQKNIEYAVSEMEVYRTRLESVIRSGDRADIEEAYYEVMPKVKNFILGRSEHTKASLAFQRSLEAFEYVVQEIETILDIKKGVNWGAILGIGAAAAGAYFAFS